MQPTRELTFIDLFAGIGGFRIAFERAGCRCVFSCEIDKFARHTYSANFLPEEIHWRDAGRAASDSQIFGDIRDVNIETDIPDFDILTAGFPCPTFSLAGVSKRNSLNLKHGLEDEEKGRLFFEIVRILAAKRPKAFLLENVKHLLNHDRGRTFEVMRRALVDELEYWPVTWQVFDAALLVPQHRERVFIAGLRKDLDIPFDIRRISIPDREPRLRDILQPEEEVPDDYTITDHLWRYLQDYRRKHESAGNGFGYSVADVDGVSRTMSARYHKDGSEILIDQGPGRPPRMLTEREAARLFGFPEDFIIPVSRTQAYRQFGNSVCVPLVSILADHLCAALRGDETPALAPEGSVLRPSLFDGA